MDIDFRVSGFPHAVVKQAENSRVRELVKKIEIHLHWKDLQADLQQSNAYNPFSEKSKKMIRDLSNACIWVMRDNSKSAMLRMPSLLELRHRLLHLWASLERESIQPRYPPMAVGSSLNPELCHHEGATSWQSSWEDWRTNKTLCCPEWKKQMHQQEFSRSSRSLSERFN